MFRVVTVTVLFEALLAMKSFRSEVQTMLEGDWVVTIAPEQESLDYPLKPPEVAPVVPLPLETPNESVTQATSQRDVYDILPPPDVPEVFVGIPTVAPTAPDNLQTPVTDTSEDSAPQIEPEAQPLITFEDNATVEVQSNTTAQEAEDLQQTEQLVDSTVASDSLETENSLEEPTSQTEEETTRDIPSAIGDLIFQDEDEGWDLITDLI